MAQRFTQISADEEERRLVLKGKMLGNIKFIGELGKRQLISERILHECVKQLLSKVWFVVR
jgi:translation initiation factor 4G